MTATRTQAVGPAGPTGPPGVGASWKGAWSSGTTYALGDGVSRSGMWFISNQGSNLNHDPATDNSATWWTRLEQTGGLTININQAPYNAKGDGKQVTDATIASASTSLTSASAAFTAADIGKHILINGAGAAGVALHTTISNVAAGVATLANAAGTSVTNSTAVFATDDTAAFQAAINAIWTARGGRIGGADGIYGIGGALQTTAATAGTYNSQLTIPGGTAASSAYTLEIGGNGFPFRQGMISALPNTNGMILQSFQVGAGAGSGFPSVIGGPVGTLSSTIALLAFTVFHNFAIRCHHNPTISGLNLIQIHAADLDSVSVDTTQVGNAFGGSNIDQPTHPTAVGVHMPGDWNQVLNRARMINVSGFYGGIALGEYTHADACYVFYCKVAYPVTSGYHGIKVGRSGSNWCTYVIGAVDPVSGLVAPDHGPATTIALYWDIMDIEEASLTGGIARETWAPTVAHIYDPGNQISGEIRTVHRVLSDVGQIAEPLVCVGASQLVIDYPQSVTTGPVNVAGASLRYWGDVARWHGSAPAVGGLTGRPRHGGGSTWVSTVGALASLVSYWRLGDAFTGTVADSKGTNTGTTHNVITAVDLALPFPGDSTVQPAWFDGSGYISIPDAVSLHPAAFTMFAWVYHPGPGHDAGAPSTNAAQYIYACRNDADTLGIGMLLYQGRYGVAVNGQSLFGPLVPSGRHTLVGVTYDGTTTFLYMNGAQTANQAMTAPTYTSVNPRIGAAFSTPASFYKGGLMEIGLCNAALSLAQMEDLYKAGPDPYVAAFGHPTGNGKGVITGAKGGNAALTNLLTYLRDLGLIFDRTT